MRALSLQELPQVVSWPTGRVPTHTPTAPRRTNSVCPPTGLNLYPSQIWPVVIYGQQPRNFSWPRCFIGWGPCLSTKGPCLSYPRFVRDGRHRPRCVMTTVTTPAWRLDPKPQLLVLTLSFQQSRRFSLHRGRCTCHTPYNCSSLLLNFRTSEVWFLG